MRYYWLMLGIICVWRVTHLLHAEDGPWDLLVHMRRVAGAGFWGRLLNCFYCLSLWIAALFSLVLAEGWKERLLLWPAMSGAAILLERATSNMDSPPPYYVEDQEDHNVLQQGQTAISNVSSEPTDAGSAAPGPEASRTTRR
jgi:hypothetical protein